MSRQTNARFRTCQHKSVCDREAILGVFQWQPGQTDVDLNKPLRVYCGKHKPTCEMGVNQRVVRLRR